MNNPRVNFRIFLAITACAVMAGSCGVSFGQADEIKESDTQQLQILLRTEGLDLISPERINVGSDLTIDQMLPLATRSALEKRADSSRMLQTRKLPAQASKNLDTHTIREQLAKQIEILANQGNDVQTLKDIFEKLQQALKAAEETNEDNIAVAVFAVPEEPQHRPDGNPKPTPPMIHSPIEHHPGFTPPMAQHPMVGRPGFMPPMLMMEYRMQEHQGPGPQIHRPEMHQPAGPFAEDQKRIAVLTESAERLSHAGLPDAAHGLMERAGQIKREVAEKQERIRHEDLERAQAKMREQKEQAQHQKERMTEQRHDSAESDDRPALPLHGLHEQLEQLRREVHSINEKVSHLIEMIEHHHQAQQGAGHREEMDDDDRDEDDDDHEKDDRDRDDNGEEERNGEYTDE